MKISTEVILFVFSRVFRSVTSYFLNSFFVLFLSIQHAAFAKAEVGLESNILPKYELSSLPYCELDLSISGTILGSEKLAFIRVEGRNDVPYKINQIIQSGVVLVDILPRGAVISHDGVLEKVGLKGGVTSREEISLGDNISTSPFPAQIRDYQHANQMNASPKAPYRFLGIPFAPSDIFQQADIISEEDGLKIIKTTQGGVYEHIGLQSGDKIIAVNGDPVISLLDVFNSVQKERENKNKTVTTLIRDGNFYNMEIDPQRGVEFTIVTDLEQIQP